MNNKINKISPLPNMLLTIGLLPSSYIVSMTYEEQLLWLCNFLKTEVIPKTNANIKAVNELITYIENYFDNLDVQEEINNKLDEMAEDGTLESIISEYLNTNSLIIFNTIDDLKNATNLINGSTVKTLGYYELNDGGGSIYKIRPGTNEDDLDENNLIPLNNFETLVAELYIEDGIVNILSFGIKCDGETDDSFNINKAIKYAYKNKYYNVIVGSKEKNIHVENSILLPTNINIDFNKAKLTGTSSIAIILSAKYDETTDTLIATTDATTQESTFSYKITSNIKNGYFDECLVAIKMNALTYGSKINDSYFNSGCTKAIVLNNCWGSSIEDNKFYAPIEVTNYADWFTIKGNSFETNSLGYGILLQYNQSTRIVSNGFHSLEYGIKMSNNVYDTIIEANHFEVNHYCVYGDSSSVVQRARVSNNWMKATASVKQELGSVYGIVINNAIDCDLSHNYFDESTSTFDNKVNTPASSRGNILDNIGSNYNSSADKLYILPDISKYSGTHGIIKESFGSLSNPMPSQHQVDANGYTYEKYYSKYNLVNNQIPFAKVTSGSSYVEIETEVPCNYESSTGKTYCTQPVLCWFDFISTDNLVKHSEVILINFENIVKLSTSKKANDDQTTSSQITYSLVNNDGLLKIRINNFATTTDKIRTRGFIKMI